AVPPVAGTCINPELPSGANTMRPSDVQVPPAESDGAGVMRCGGPLIETVVRQRDPREKYATDLPSGEKNGVLAPVVSASSRSFAAPCAISRKNRTRRPS